MARICDLLRRCPDPWHRVLTENAIRESGLDGAEQKSATLDEVQFNQWFDMVTDQRHIEEERTIFRADWQEEQVRFQQQWRVGMN